MPQSAYPTTAEVTEALEEQGLTAPGTLSTIVAAVIADFERGTGYRPFLADAAATTCTFDPPYRQRDYILDLEGAFATITAVEIDDDALTVTDDYLKLPLNAAGEDPARGWDELKFLFHPGSEPGTVEVTGRRGLYIEIPDDAWQAMFDEMMARAIVHQAGPGLAKRIKQSEVEIDFDNEAGRSKIDRWRQAFKDAKLKYRRIS